MYLRLIRFKTLGYLTVSALCLSCMMFVMTERTTYPLSKTTSHNNKRASPHLNIFNFDELRKFTPPYRCKEVLPYLFNTTFVVCYKHPLKDAYISVFLDKYKRYEEDLVNDFLSALNNYPESYVVDLGSNIGVFTLAAAANDHRVISVDPMIENHGLVYNSLVLNFKVDLVTQLVNCISDNHTEYLANMENPINPGDTVMVDANDFEIEQVKEQKLYSISSVTLRDLLELVPEGAPAILKLDVQGYECKALKELTDRGQMQRYIPYIVVEMVMICNKDSEFCPEYRQSFLPGMERAGYVPHVPHPVSYKNLENSCPFNVFFVHKSAKPVPHLTQPHLTYDYFDYMRSDAREVFINTTALL